ncbi:MAG: hypothetical protein ABFS34_05600 [Gemmatimonadota bacterium]
MTRLARIDHPPTTLFVRERRPSQTDAWPESAPWGTDYDLLASLGPLRDLGDGAATAVRSALAIQSTLACVAPRWLEGAAVDRPHERAARRLAASAAGELRGIAIRTLRAARGLGRLGPDPASAATLCTCLRDLARLAPGPGGTGACHRLGFAVARRHRCPGHAAAAARALGKLAAAAGDHVAEQRWERWADA